MPKMVNFGEFLKTCNLRSEGVTSYINLMENAKIESYFRTENETFWVIFGLILGLLYRANRKMGGEKILEAA